MPKLRLPEIEMTHPPVLELYQGDRLIHSRTLSIFGDLCYTTREVSLCLTGRETDMNPNQPFDLVVRLRCGEEEFYCSDAQLMRDYLVFNRSGEEIKVLPHGLEQVCLLTNSRTKVELPEDEDIDMFGSFGQFYILSVETARQTLINGQPVLPEVGVRSCLRVSFAKEPEELEVLSGNRRLQVFTTVPEAKIISTERGVGKRYLVLCDNVRKQLYNYENDDANDRFRVPLPKMPNYPHTFQIFDIETEKTVFELEYMVLNNFSCTFERSFYLNRNCTGRASIRAGGNTRTIDFQLEVGQKQMLIPLWGGYTAVVPVPRLEIFIDGENALTMQRPWIWHEELRVMSQHG